MLAKTHAKILQHFVVPWKQIHVQPELKVKSRNWEKITVNNGNTYG